MQRRHFLVSSATKATAATFFSQIVHASAQNKGSDAWVIGCTAAMTGPLGGFGRNMKLGVDAAFAQINAKGGIHGRPLKFEVMDDAYVPAKSLENTKVMQGNANVVALMSCLGTPNNAVITPYLEQTDLFHLAPLTGAASLRSTEIRNVLHIRASYTDEVQRLVQNLVSMGIKDLALVYLDNAYGKEVLRDAAKAMESAGIKLGAQIALSTDGKNLDQVVAQVIASKPAGVLLGTAGAATTGLVASLKKNSPMMPIAGVSAALTQEGIAQLGVAAQGLAITMVFPDPNRARLALVREYQAAMQGIQQTELSTGSLEGYINARVMAEGLNRAGRGATRGKLRTAVATLRRFDLGGFDVNFGAHQPNVASRFVDLGVLSADGKLRG